MKKKTNTFYRQKQPIKSNPLTYHSQITLKLSTSNFTNIENSQYTIDFGRLTKHLPIVAQLPH